MPEPRYGILNDANGLWVENCAGRVEGTPAEMHKYLERMKRDAPRTSADWIVEPLPAPSSESPSP